MMIAVTTPNSPTLRGRHVQLEPLRSDMIDDLVAASSGDRASYTWAWVPDNRADMQHYIDHLLAAHTAGRAMPFVQRRIEDDRIVGCTRFMNLDRWSLAAKLSGIPDEVEIGGTWLHPDAQRTPINSEAKLMLLTFAFDTWNVHRVAICADARNERSRRAVARLGATFEGVLRSHRESFAAGEAGIAPRDTAVYSIIRADWPTVRTNLEELLT